MNLSKSDKRAALIGAGAVAGAAAVSFLAARGGLGLEPEHWHLLCVAFAILVEIILIVRMVTCISSCDGEGGCILRCVAWFLVTSFFVILILWRCVGRVVA